MESSACDPTGPDTGLIRSLLFVPGDSEKKLARGFDAGADALILDLEDSVAAPRKAAARALVAQCLQERARSAAGVSLWVRINPLSTPLAAEDLASVVAGRPAGLVVPKLKAPRELGALASDLAQLERRYDIPEGATKLLPIATETPASLFTMMDYAETGPRLEALTWGAEDLSAALGASTALDDDGEWLFTYQLARSLCLAAAAAAGVGAVDTVYTDFRDADGLRRQALQARRDGFTGKLAIHPNQIPIINEAFRPSDDELDAARGVVAAFDAAGDAAGRDGTATGVVALNGKMLDRPHLLRARRLLALAGKWKRR